MAEYLQQIRRLSASLYLFSTMLVAVLAYSSGVDGNHRVEVFSLLTLAFATGLFVRWFPWYQHHPNWFLAIGLASSVMLSLLIYWTGGVNSAFFPLYFFVVVASGAYYRTRPLILVTAFACVAAVSYLLYSGPPTLDRMLPALVLVSTLVVVAIICNVIFLGLQKNVESAELRAKFIAALHDVDLAILSEGSVDVSLKVATERLKEILTCDRAITRLWTVDSPYNSSSNSVDPDQNVGMPSREGYSLSIPLMAQEEILGELRLSWARDQEPKPEVKQLAHGFAAQLAIIVQTARLSRQAEEARRLRELNRLQDEFISMVSHDFRTPLTSIVGYSELLTANRFSPAAAASAVERIHRSALDLSRMVDDLLDITRLNAGRLQLKLDRFDINLLVRHAVETTSVVSARHQLSIEAPSEPLWAVVDQLRIGEVLNNLIGNAVRYSPDGGVVTIRVRGNDDVVTIAVVDRGVGIPHEEQSHIFDRYYRGSNVKDVVSGTGLGLAICRGLVQAHGGQIWVESEGRGHGSQFSFVIPRFNGENQPPSDGAVAP